MDAFSQFSTKGKGPQVQEEKPIQESNSNTYNQYMEFKGQLQPNTGSNQGNPNISVTFHSNEPKQEQKHNQNTNQGQNINYDYNQGQMNQNLFVPQNQNQGQTSNNQYPDLHSNVNVSTNQNYNQGQSVPMIHTSYEPISNNQGQSVPMINNSYQPISTNQGQSVPMINSSFQPISTNSVFQGVPGCHKCGGTGYKSSKKKSHKSKPCKVCMKALGHCSKCNNTGFKIKNPSKACKCKGKSHGGGSEIIMLK
jgi:hypothetical protein